MTKILLALSLAAVACGDDKGADSACIEDAAMPSVQAVVTDAVGSPLADATVTWSSGGSDPEPCDAVGNQFLCGMDETGTLSVTGAAPDHVSQTVDVTVESDGCHAITQTQTFRLDPE